MKIKSSWLVLSSIIAILILTVYAFFIYNRSQREDNPFPEDQSQTQPETDYKVDSAYPQNLIEGVITSIEISPSEGKFKVKVDLNQMFQEEISSTREVTVSINENTEFFLFDFGTGAETNIRMEDFKEGDSVVVAIKEKNAEILTQDTFTGIGVKKMVNFLEGNIQ